MLRRARRPAPRRGAALVESALVSGVALLLLFGLMQGAVAVSRYQQVAHAAREASRYAALHGTEWAADPYVKTYYGNPSAASATDVYQKGVLPQAIGMYEAGITYSVTWNTNNQPYHTGTDIYGNTSAIINYVTVTVTYTWQAGLLGQLSVSSTSSSPMFF